MKKEVLLKLLGTGEHEEQFASYIIGLEMARTKEGKIVNPFIQGRKEEEMVILFKRVAKDGLFFDGKHITLQSTGISYDYVAYKNKMLIAYPESKVDVALVYKDDIFEASKESGSVVYHHNIVNPFLRNEKDIIGGYCVIQNKRGEFITLLTKGEIDKHRKTAKTDFIWNQWFTEMALKTVIKKAVKQHFADVYENIETIDNENNSLENPLDLDLKYKQEIEKIENIDDLKKYYQDNRGLGADFDLMIVKRQTELTAK